MRRRRCTHASKDDSHVYLPLLLDIFQLADAPQ
jgi:hypothetical protein